MKSTTGIRTPKAVQALAPVNYFFALFANTLNIATHLKLAEASGNTHFDWLLDIGPFPWPENLDHHFVCRAGKSTTIEIRTSQHERSDCVTAIREHFAQFSTAEGLGADLVKHLENVEKCLKALQKVIDKGAPSGSSFATLLRKAAPILDPPGPKAPAKISRIKATDDLVKALLSMLVGEAGFPDYIVGKLNFFALRLSSPITLRELYYNTVFGPYYIIRKARSAITDAPEDRDLIVRDLLWIQPLESSPTAKGYRSNDPSTPTTALGYYISAMDQQVYEITNIAVRDELVMLDAVAFLNGTETKSVCVYFPVIPMEATQHAGFASIIGSLRDRKRTGAWNALIARPDLEDQTALLRLHFTLIFFTDCFALDNFEDKRVNYDPFIDEIYLAFANSGHCGVLYSRDWLWRAKQESGGEVDGVSVEDLRYRISAFEQCFEYTEDRIRVLEAFVEELILDVADGQSDWKGVSRAQLRQILMEIYKRAEHTAITPSSVRDSEETFHYFANPKNTPSLPYRRRRK